MKKHKEWIYFSAAVAYTLLIFYLSHQSRPIRDFEMKGNVDKLVHFVEYGVFALLWWKGLKAVRKWDPFKEKIVLIFGALYAASDEIHQSFIPGRQASGFDWLADCVGILLTLYVMSQYAKDTD